MFCIEIWKKEEVKRFVNEKNIPVLAKDLKIEESALKKLMGDNLNYGCIFRLILTLYFKSKNGLINEEYITATPKEFWEDKKCLI